MKQTAFFASMSAVLFTSQIGLATENSPNSGVMQSTLYTGHLLFGRERLPRPSLPIGIPAIVSFGQEDRQILTEAGRKLRERATPRRERFQGLILSLQAEPGSLFDDAAGKIVVRTRVGGEPARIKVLLNREDYRLACNAHRDERRVAVSGIIHHDDKVRVCELSEPSDFQVLDPA